MTDFLADIRPYLEATYFLAQVALLGVAVYALKQISLLKLDIRLRTERAAKEKAIEAAETYLNTFITLYRVFYHDRIARKVDTWPGDVGDFTAASLNGSPHAQLTQARFDLDTWLPAINMLESIAATYVTGVADEQIGFQTIGRTFCATVETNYDLIARVRSHGANPYFSNIVALYRTWAPRLTRAELDEARNALDERASAIKTSTIPIIGAHN